MIQRFLNNFRVAGFICLLAGLADAQTPSALNWQQVQEKFAAANPTLRAGLLNIDEGEGK